MTVRSACRVCVYSAVLVARRATDVALEMACRVCLYSAVFVAVLLEESEIALNNPRHKNTMMITPVAERFPILCEATRFQNVGSAGTGVAKRVTPESLQGLQAGTAVGGVEID